MKNQLLRFLGFHMLVGIFLGWCFAGFLFYTDYAGIWTLITHSSIGGIAAGLLLMGFAITFGSVGMGLAIFSLHYEDEDGGGGKRQRTSRPWGAWLETMQELKPIRVRTRNRR
ncbi:MAG TPA: hypothetical protein ENJ57_02100 [Rhizobiales bacterium]|nr:hypothetical protein [Hyphomicrobiales bacterium]